MSLETFKLIFDPQTEKIRQLKFCGQFGDPMMNPSVGKMLDHALRYDKMNILINTNGGLRNVEWYKTFAQRYGNRLQMHFGIDGLEDNDLFIEAAKRLQVLILDEIRGYGICDVFFFFKDEIRRLTMKMRKKKK